MKSSPRRKSYAESFVTSRSGVAVDQTDENPCKDQHRNDCGKRTDACEWDKQRGTCKLEKNNYDHVANLRKYYQRVGLPVPERGPSAVRCWKTPDMPYREVYRKVGYCAQLPHVAPTSVISQIITSTYKTGTTLDPRYVVARSLLYANKSVQSRILYALRDLSVGSAAGVFALVTTLKVGGYARRALGVAQPIDDAIAEEGLSFVARKLFVKLSNSAFVAEVATGFVMGGPEEFHFRNHISQIIFKEGSPLFREIKRLEKRLQIQNVRQFEAFVDIVLSSVMFGLYHLSNAPIYGVRIVLAQVFFTTIMGFLLAGVKRNVSLTTAYVAHSVHNSLLSIAFTDVPFYEKVSILFRELLNRIDPPTATSAIQRMPAALLRQVQVSRT